MSRVIPTMLLVRRLNKVITRFYSKGPRKSLGNTYPTWLISIYYMPTLNGIKHCEDQSEIIKIENKDKYYNNSGSSCALID